MEKLIRYKNIVKSIIGEIASIRAKHSGEIKTQTIMDDERGHYLLYKNGWKDQDRFYGCFLHIDISDDGKIWLNHDGTDLIIAQMLLDKGVPKEDIVLAWNPPVMRVDTGFAVA